VERTLGRASLAPIGQKLQFKEPKTKKSSRMIPLEQKVVTALKRQKLQAKSNPNDLVFPNGFGNPMEPSTPYRALKRSLQRIADGIGDDDPKAQKRWSHLAKTLCIHDLRRTAATHMIQNRASAKDVQDILGHATYATTMDIYVHTTPSSLRDAMERGAAPSPPVEEASGDVHVFKRERGS